MCRSQVHSVRTAALLMALGATLLFGCSAANEAEEASGTIPVEQTSEPVISGARVVQTTFSSVSVAPGKSFTVSPACSSGVLIGAGFSTHFKTRVFASAPAGNSWSVSDFNPDTVSHDLSAELYCLTGTNAKTSVSSSTNATIRNNNVGCLTATCPSGSFAVNGGWNAGTAFHPYISQPDGTGWAVCGKNTDFFNTIKFQSYALCISGVKGSTTVGAQTSVTIARNANGVINGGPCPTGQLVGGGTFNLASNGFQGIPFHVFRGTTRVTTEVRNPDLSNSITVRASTACLNLSP